MLRSAVLSVGRSQLRARGFRSSSALLEKIKVKVPPMGEAVNQGDIVEWFKKPGDAVKDDEVICVLETDKVTVDIRAPAAGVLAEVLASVEETVKTNQEIAVIDTDTSASPSAASTPKPAAPASAPAVGEEEEKKPASAGTAADSELHLPPPRQPLIHFRHGKREGDSEMESQQQHQQQVQTTPVKPAQTPSRISVPPGPGARTEFVDLPPEYGRLPPMTEDESLRLQLGGAEP